MKVQGRESWSRTKRWRGRCAGRAFMVYGCDLRGLHGEGREGEKSRVRVWISIRLFL
jgi:hypothetical protein